MKHEAEIQQQTITETPCTETAPCFACLRCSIRLLNFIPEAARKADAAIEAADGGGQWTPSPEKPDHYTFGPLSAERTITLTANFVATLPTGERIDLPAGTVLREAPTPIQLANAEEERAILPRATRVEVRSRAGSQPIVTVEDDAGRTIRLVRVGAAEAMRHGDPPDEPKTLGEQLHDEHNRTTHADGSCCLCDPATTVLADLTERAGLPREMAPSVTVYDPNDSSWAARYAEAMRVNKIQHAEIERLREQIEDSATPADRAVGAAMLGSLR